jgi:hypothetical protein
MTPEPCPIAASASAPASSRPSIDNDVFLADTSPPGAERLSDIVLVGHSFGSLIASLVTDRVADASAHLGHHRRRHRPGRPIDLRPHPASIVAKRKTLVQRCNGTEVLPIAPVGSLIIDDPTLAAWTTASSRLIRWPATPSRSGLNHARLATAGR